MNDTFGVGILQSTGDVNQVQQSFGVWHEGPVADLLVEVLSREEFLNQKGCFLLDPEVEDADDVGVVELARDLRLTGVALSELLVG